MIHVQEKEKPTERSEEIPKLSTLRKEKKFKKVDRPAFLTHLDQ